MATTTEKRTIWKSDTKQLVEVGSPTGKGYVSSAFYSADELRDLAEAAAAAADALDLMAETETKVVRIAE
jgi:hypothetical protein